MAGLPPHACFDIIGDIHGYAEDLEVLLGRLGYRDRDGAYRHPDGERRVVFLGDFIDRGPDILRVLKIVRDMIEAGTAYAVLGNHEFNAIAYATRHDGRYLREHTPGHERQHRHTLEQLGGLAVQDSWLDWFRTLPPYLANDELRVVHACWDPWAVEVMDEALSRHGGMTDAFMTEALPLDQNSALYMAVEWLLKGKEIPLPNGYAPVADKEGIRRSKIRVRWFGLPPRPTYPEMVFPASSTTDLPTVPVPDEALCALRLPGNAYPAAAPPVFFGHYWLTGEVAVQTPNAVCLDYSVARVGKLVACTWRRGEPITAASFTASR